MTRMTHHTIPVFMNILSPTFNLLLYFVSNTLTPSNSTFPFNPPSSQPPPPVFQPMTPSVPSAALTDLIKLFEGLDHTYTPEKVLLILVHA